jgi:hypothetical protein
MFCWWLMQLALNGFLCFCYYHDHQYVICCNSWIQVSVPDHPPPAATPAA